MPLKVSVGLSKKVELPGDESLGASCSIELELDSSLLQNNLGGFHHHIQAVYGACAQAVQDELTRQRNTGTVAVPTSRPSNAIGHGGRNSQPRNEGSDSSHVSRKKVDDVTRFADRIEGLGSRGLNELTDRMFHKPLTELSSLEASSLIATLRDLEAGRIDVKAVLGGAAA